MERHLAAILVADVVGYTHLMEMDEVGTLDRLGTLRDKHLVPKIREHGGRVFKFVGDGLLAEFPSIVEAVQCAVNIQRENVERNATLPEAGQIRLRIGVNLGDIIVEGDDIFGDGVNLASRLEPLAETNGVCITRHVYDQVANKVDGSFEDIGEHTLKNISQPVHAYSFRPDQSEKPKRTGRRGKGGIGSVSFGAAAIIVAAIVFWYGEIFAPDVGATRTPSREMPVIDQRKPTIAVLPLTNISGSEDQEYFADGMTEDLTTDLSKVSGLNILSRSMTSVYKGRSIDVREIGETLKVNYVIEGSARKIGDQVRINVQLVNAKTGAQLWADRYDGSFENIFHLQDQLLGQIVDTLTVRLSEEERSRIAAKGTFSVVAHDLYLKGLYQESFFTREGNAEAKRLYEQALSIDPDYALPYAQIANILELGSRNGWTDDISGDLERAVRLAEKAVELDPQDPGNHWSLGRATSRLGGPQSVEKGIASLETAIRLDPDFADAYAYLCVLFVADGRAEDGLRSVETAMKLNPNFPFWYIFMRGMTRYVVEEYDAAIADFETAMARSPTALFVQWWLAAAYAQVGRIDDAEWQVEEMMMAGFDGSIATIMHTQPIRDEVYLARYREGLLKAGIPE